MEPVRLDVGTLAEALALPQARMERVIADQEPMTPDVALRLARYFRTSPQFWLGLQTSYDLAQAQSKYGAEIEARVQPLAA